MSGQQPDTSAVESGLPSRPARHRAHQRPARPHTIMIRLDDTEHAAVLEGARRAGLTPAGFAAVAAVNTARGIDTAADITWREAIHELSPPAPRSAATPPTSTKSPPRSTPESAHPMDPARHPHHHRRRETNRRRNRRTAPTTTLNSWRN